jgi:multidrug efflux pump subunit AcrA (membrane-fusion protein)
MAEFQVKSSTIRRDQTLKVDLPRQEVNVRENAVRQDLALRKANTTLPLTLEQKRVALDKLKHDYVKSTERLANLKKDRELFTIKAPADGIVYHGKCVKGQWNSSSITPKLQRGGTLSPDEVFITIVNPRPLVVDATVDEKDLHWLKVGARGKAVPTGYPDVHLPAELTSLSGVPQSAGNFAAAFKVDSASAPETILPGMACTVKLIAYRNENALTLPSSAVHSDDDEEHYVYKAGSKEKVRVQAGKTFGDKTEILGGLNAGDEILTSKP